MLARQVLESLQRVIDHNHLVARDFQRAVDDGVGAALLKGSSGKLVAVKRFAFQRQKDTPCRTVAAVGSDARVLLIELVEFLNCHVLRNFGAKLQNKLNS